MTLVLGKAWIMGMRSARFGLTYKKPRLSKMLPACSIQNVLLRKNVKSKRRGRDAIGETGMRGLTKHSNGPSKIARVTAHALNMVAKLNLVRPQFIRNGITTPLAPVPALQDTKKY